jgi:hypothetical protein
VALQEFVKEASKNGMISEVSDFIDSSNYIELISRLSANKTEKIEGIIPRIEGI